MELLQKIAENLGATVSVNGSWMQTIALQEGATETVNGSWVEAWADAVGVDEPLGGSWLQAIADYYGVTDSAGDWLIGIETATSNPPPPPPDPDAEAFINASGITGTNASAITQLVDDLKAYNLWDRMQAVYPFVGSTAGDHKWNLLDPQDTNAAKRLTFNGTWTHDSGGADPNGSSGTWASTWFQPSGDSFWSGITGSTGAHMSIDIVENNSAAGYDMGAFEEGNEWMIISNFGNDTAYGLLGAWAANWVTYSNTDTVGYYVASQKEGTLTDYKDGINKASGSRDFAILTGADTYIALAGSGRSGNTATDPSVRKIDFATIGYGLTAGDVTNLTNAVDAYKTTIGR